MDRIKRYIASLQNHFSKISLSNIFVHSKEFDFCEILFWGVAFFLWWIPYSLPSAWLLRTRTKTCLCLFSSVGTDLRFLYVFLMFFFEYDPGFTYGVYQKSDWAVQLSILSYIMERIRQTTCITWTTRWIHLPYEHISGFLTTYEGNKFYFLQV